MSNDNMYLAIQAKGLITFSLKKQWFEQLKPFNVNT